MPRSGYRRAPMRWDTRLIHDGQEPDPYTGAVNVPIYQTSTFAQISPGKAKGYVYSRTGNPTRAALERALGRIESGVGALAFGSGLAAATALFMAYPSGARIVAGDDLYHGATRLLHIAETHGVRVDFIDTSDLANVRAALAEGPHVDLLYLESPTNPLLKITDLKGAATIAHRYRTRVAVDNTFSSPILQRPLELGADLVLHSMTKYLGGHSDLLGGALVFRDRRLLERYRWYQNTSGGVPGPVDCFLVLRGLRTLGLRVRRHCSNARRVARFLDRHPKVTRTFYPGLPSHPGHAIARRQMDDFGGMVSAELRGGYPAVRRFVRRLKVFTLAESLGGVESLVNHPAKMTHREVPPELRAQQGISDGLLRFSVGIEDPDDLVEDLARALG